MDQLDEPLTEVPSGGSLLGSSACEACLLIEVEVYVTRANTHNELRCRNLNGRFDGFSDRFGATEPTASGRRRTF